MELTDLATAEIEEEARKCAAANGFEVSMVGSFVVITEVIDPLGRQLTSITASAGTEPEGMVDLIRRAFMLLHQ
jgi:hypothetical protein